MKHPTDLHDTYFNQTQAAQYLNRSLRWFQIQLAGSQPPPGFKIGKSWLFKRTELDRWVEKFRAHADLGRVVDQTVSDILGE